MLLQILVHTPAWVFALFLLLLWLGLRQIRPHRIGLRRVSLLPVAMVGLSLYGVYSAFGSEPRALLAWALSAAAVAALVLRLPLPAAVRYDAATRSFAMPGSPVPLLLFMGIFFTKYTVGVQLAMHPELARGAGFAIGVCLLYGVFSGIFAGRAARLLRRASAGRAAVAEAGILS